MHTSNVIHADLNDIIFDDRNQAYGAYYMRKAYPKTVWNAFYIATSIILAALLFAYYSQKQPIQSDSDSGLIQFTEVNLPPKPPVTPKVATPITPEKKQEKLNFKEEKAPAKGMDTQKLDKIIADPNANQDATIADNSLFKNKQPGTETTDSIGNNMLGGNPHGNPEDGNPEDKEVAAPPSKKKVEPDPFEVHLGTMPKPSNLDEIQKLIGYPREAAENGLQGKVDFKVLVDENGEYLKHITLKQTHPIFEKACAKHLKSLKFEPGKMGDQAVKVWVVIPFRFTLSK